MKFVLGKAYSIFSAPCISLSSQLSAASNGKGHQRVLQPHVIGKLALQYDRLIVIRTALIPATLALPVIIIVFLLQFLLQLVGLFVSPLFEAQIEGQTDEQHKDQGTHGTTCNARLLQHWTRSPGQVSTVDLLVLAPLSHKTNGALAAIKRIFANLDCKAMGIVQAVKGIIVLRTFVNGECYIRPGRGRRGGAHCGATCRLGGRQCCAGHR